MMKKLIIFLVFISLFYNANAQAPRTEKGTSGFQVGILGGWVYREFGVSPNIALRAEVGLDASIGYGGFYGTIYHIYPRVGFETRYYYNFSKRDQKGKSTQDNAANFIGLSIIHFPGLFAISSDPEGELNNLVAFFPKWGIRRNVGKNFNFETGAGAGIVINLDDMGNDIPIFPAYLIYLRFGVKFARSSFD